MKKFISILALVGLMVFTLSFSALGASQVYFDYIASGEVEDGDLSGLIFGGSLDINDSFYIGIDYLSGEIEDYFDYTLTFLKGGYSFSENMSMTFSVLDSTIFYDSVSVTGFLLGLKGGFEASENVTFEASYEFSLNGEYEETGYGSFDVDISVLKTKLIYYLSENMGTSFTYSSIKIEELDSNYMALGVVYKF